MDLITLQNKIIQQERIKQKKYPAVIANQNKVLDILDHIIALAAAHEIYLRTGSIQDNFVFFYSQLVYSLISLSKKEQVLLESSKQYKLKNEIDEDKYYDYLLKLLSFYKEIKSSQGFRNSLFKVIVVHANLIHNISLSELIDYINEHKFTETL